MDLLDKLKVKPIPKKDVQVVVKIVDESKPKKTVVVDKRKEKLVNREEIMSRLKNISQIKKEQQQAPAIIQTTIQKKPKPQEKQSEEVIKIKKPKKSKSRKLNRKIKIVGISQGPITTVGPVTSSKINIPDLSKPQVIEGSETELVEKKIIDIENVPKKKPNVLIKASAYYMNNREIFLNFINKLFRQYRESILKENQEFSSHEGDIVKEKCSLSKKQEFELLTHQKIVRDYLNLFTPYRGLLLYHGLGSGKTCSSIAIAEGMKSEKKIIVMTPASLRRNYIEELKNCGDPLFKKNQHWQFFSLAENVGLIKDLQNILGISSEFIEKNNGGWLVNTKKKPNYENLNADEKQSLENQLNEMIRQKYQFINYNGLRQSHLEVLTANWSRNPFDNSVIIIDEAHNFVSRIVNKLSRPESLSFRLYDYLMAAENCKIILLTGTPIINYPNEIGILFNILRGFIKVWDIPLNIKTSKKVNQDFFIKIFKTYPKLNNLIDLLKFKASTKRLVITRNPFGFIGKYSEDKYLGVTTSSKGEISDDDLIKLLGKLLEKNKIEMLRQGINIERFKALPDREDEFNSYFIDSTDGDVKNLNMFQRRIIGLTSYFRSAQEQLMPKYDVIKDFRVIKIPMSDYQFGVYEEARVKERKLEKQNAKRKKKGEDDSVSTYRIFSRAFCNFVFPRPIGRPMPRDGEDIESIIEEIAKDKVDEDVLDNPSVKEKLDNVDGRYTLDDEESLKKNKEEIIDESYEARIEKALNDLKENADRYLTPSGIMEIPEENPEVEGEKEESQDKKTSTPLSSLKPQSTGGLQIYSPKFLHVLENIKGEGRDGLHLIYSQFRTLEGVGILKLILETNGFVQFKIKKQESGVWMMDIKPEDLEKPKFALYTGTEDPEEKEILRNIYNSTWEFIPSYLRDELIKQNTNNNMGEIVKVLMITASGAEGISLRNCRFVHIIEPYWHPVRVEQVIGRARRICSHQDLPEELRTVTVFMYLMEFSEKQLSSDASIELRLKDKSKEDKKTPLTSDEALFEISNIKKRINSKILTAVKETAIDCALHSTSSSTEPIVCYSFGKSTPDKFSYYPSLTSEDKDTVTETLNKKKITWKAKELRYRGNQYALRERTGEVYDYDSYLQALKNPGVNPTLIGKLEKKGKDFRLVYI